MPHSWSYNDGEHLARERTLQATAGLKEMKKGTMNEL